MIDHDYRYRRSAVSSGQSSFCCRWLLGITLRPCQYQFGCPPVSAALYEDILATHTVDSLTVSTSVSGVWGRAYFRSHISHILSGSLARNFNSRKWAIREQRIHTLGRDRAGTSSYMLLLCDFDAHYLNSIRIPS